MPTAPERDTGAGENYQQTQRMLAEAQGWRFDCSDLTSETCGTVRIFRPDGTLVGRYFDTPGEWACLIPDPLHVSANAWELLCKLGELGLDVSFDTYTNTEGETLGRRCCVFSERTGCYQAKESGATNAAALVRAAHAAMVAERDAKAERSGT